MLCQFYMLQSFACLHQNWRNSFCRVEQSCFIFLILLFKVLLNVKYLRTAQIALANYYNVEAQLNMSWGTQNQTSNLVVSQSVLTSCVPPCFSYMIVVMYLTATSLMILCRKSVREGDLRMVSLPALTYSWQLYSRAIYQKHSWVTVKTWIIFPNLKNKF